MAEYYNQQSEAKYNAGLDAEKRIMDLFKDIDRISLLRDGNAQQAKYDLIKSLVIASRGMFNKREIRKEILEEYLKIKLTTQKAVMKQGKIKHVVVYDPRVNDQLDVLLMLITDHLQDDRGFFSPSKGELGMF